MKRTKKLDIEEIRRLLKQVEQTIHQERNRVRYVMNTFLIIVGTSVAALHEEVKQVAERVGIVRVDMGKTACKVPLATEYMGKIEAAGKLGTKRKTCIC
jgi:hypothetical protein